VSLFWLGIVSGLWFLWVAITSFGAGGYLAGRLRRPAPGASLDEVEVRDGAHGLLVWATGTILAAALAAGGITGVIGAAGRAAGTVAETAAHAVSGDVDYIASRLLRGGTAPGGEQAGLDGQTASLLARALADGELSPEDRDYLAGLVASRTGQTPEEAAGRVDAAFTEAKQLYDQAVEAAEQARVAAAIAAFLVAATLLASGAAAYTAATAGGDHRDRNIVLKW
jgi:hypothetical protein